MAKRKQQHISHPCDRLSFVADRKTAGLPEGRWPRCYWHVRNTGSYAHDCDLGQALAIAFLNLPTTITGPLLASIVGDMPRPLTGIEIGFLGAVGDMAKAGHREVARMSLFWMKPAGRRAA